MSDVPQAALDWIASGDTGLSSEAIWAHMAGSRMLDNDRRGYSFPHDPDDLGRCLRLLDAVPEWKARIGEMAQHSPYWAALVARWDELAKCMEDEVGIAWQKGRSAPKTYALMREILDPVYGDG